MKKSKSNVNVSADIAESLGLGSYRTASPVLEKKVIGICFRRPSELQVITSNLTAEDFSDPRYRVFFSYVAATYASGRLPDIDVCLTTALRSSDYEIETEDYQAAITSALGADLDGDTEAACHEIHDLHVQRRLLGLARRIEGNISDGRPSADLISQAEEFIRKISGEAVGADTLMDIDALIASSPRGIGEFLDPQSDGIPSPWPTINSLIYGFRPQHFYVIGARPAVGKTLALCQIAYHAAKLKHRVCFFSLEMSAWDLWVRIFCSEMGLGSTDFMHRQLTDKEKDRVRDFIRDDASRTLLISDKGGRTPLSMRSEITRNIARYGHVDMVCVDYLQLMDFPGKSKDRFQEVSAISRAIKSMAMDLNTRFIVAAQLNRMIDSRANVDNTPRLSDLKDSGSIEQDADVVIFPNRPAMYTKKKDGIPPPDDELIVSKQRRGPIGKAVVKFQGEHYRFLEQV